MITCLLWSRAVLVGSGCMIKFNGFSPYLCGYIPFGVGITACQVLYFTIQHVLYYCPSCVVLCPAMLSITDLVLYCGPSWFWSRRHQIGRIDRIYLVTDIQKHTTIIFKGWIVCHCPADTWRDNNVIITSNDVATSFCNNAVIITPCVRLVWLNASSYNKSFAYSTLYITTIFSGMDT